MIYVAVLLLIISGAMLDSESTIPIKVCALTLAYLIWWLARREML